LNGVGHKVGILYQIKQERVSNLAVSVGSYINGGILMGKLIEVSTIDEEFEKSRVKAHTRTRKGKMERVKEHERKGSRFPTLNPSGSKTNPWAIPPKDVSKHSGLNDFISKLQSKGHKVKILKDTYKTAHYEPGMGKNYYNTRAVLEIDGKKTKVFKHGSGGVWMKS